MFYCFVFFSLRSWPSLCVFIHFHFNNICGHCYLEIISEKYLTVLPFNHLVMVVFVYFAWFFFKLKVSSYCIRVLYTLGQFKSSSLKKLNTLIPKQCGQDETHWHWDKNTDSLNVCILQCENPLSVPTFSVNYFIAASDT